MACHLCRRSFKYKPLQDDEESASLAAAAGAHADAAAGSDSVSPTCRSGGLTADLELAEAAAAAHQASAAARASRAAHKEALTAAAQVRSGGCLSQDIAMFQLKAVLPLCCVAVAAAGVLQSACVIE
jgi:hypothetical protein